MPLMAFPMRRQFVVARDRGRVGFVEFHIVHRVHCYRKQLTEQGKVNTMRGDR
jgi:stage III sporulation protein SpoIIIAA